MPEARRQLPRRPQGVCGGRRDPGVVAVLSLSESWFLFPPVGTKDPSSALAASVSSADEAIALGSCPAGLHCAGTIGAWNFLPPAAKLCTLPTC